LRGSICPACAGALAPWRRAPASEPALAGSFLLLRCNGCGTAVTGGSPVPELHDSGAYAAAPPRLARAAAPVLHAFDRARLRLLARVAPPPGRLLDVGAGRGRFVAAARTAGYDASGLEPSAGRARAAEHEHGVRLAPGGIEEADVGAGSLDAVTLWHVLEHVEAPGPPLARIAGWLRPGGALLVGVPNLGSLQARAGGRRWYHLDLPRHRTHFTVPGLLALLRRAGLEPVSVHHVLAEHNAFGMWQSLVNRATTTPSYLYNLLKRNANPAPADLAVSLLALPLVPAAAGLELAAGAARRGGTVAVAAVRAG
jgi:SAM-dependent methyltransferase